MFIAPAHPHKCGASIKPECTNTLPGAFSCTLFAAVQTSGEAGAIMMTQTAQQPQRLAASHMTNIDRCPTQRGFGRMQVKLEPTDKTDKANSKKASYKQSCKTPTVARNHSPRWSNQNKFTLYDVSDQVSRRLPQHNQFLCRCFW
jgi:hypothetical protein